MSKKMQSKLTASTGLRTKKEGGSFMFGCARIKPSRQVAKSLRTQHTLSGMEVTSLTRGCRRGDSSSGNSDVASRSSTADMMNKKEQGWSVVTLTFPDVRATSVHISKGFPCRVLYATRVEAIAQVSHDLLRDIQALLSQLLRGRNAIFDGYVAIIAAVEHMTKDHQSYWHITREIRGSIEQIGELLNEEVEDIDSRVY